jgi:hypothetical protein
MAIAPPNVGWMTAQADTLARMTGLEMGTRRPIAIARHEGLEIEFKGATRTLIARMVAVGDHRYVVTASAPVWGEAQRRFLESFTLADSISSP